MVNEITLRTSKGEYLPGQPVYGAVYLHVTSPTEATGIGISFKGCETCVYTYECDGSKTLKNETAHVDFSDVTLYSQSEYFEFDSYVFPFKFDLPKEIPGTFHCKGCTNNTSWEVSVVYILQAKAIGADILQVSQLVVINQVQELALIDSPLGSAHTTAYIVSQFLFQKKKIHIIAKLIENYKESGSNMQLRLVVKNPTRLKVKRFRILLLRYMQLYVRDNLVEKKVLDNMEYNGEVCHIAPECGPHVVYNIEGAVGGILRDSFGLDQLQIPLRERSQEEGIEKDIPPSVAGKHIKNQYQLEITITFDDNHNEILHLPIPGVLPHRNQQWLQWKAPDWTFTAKTKLSGSLFSVQQSYLRTEAFSGLPTFQVL